MQQFLKKVVKTTSVIMCFSAMVTMVPTVTQAHDDVIININANPSADGEAPVPVVINKSAVPTDVRAGSCNICELQAVTGPCKQNLPRYYYDVDARACKEFTYGGCEGNQNRFLTSKDCEAKCANLPSMQGKLPSMQGKGTCWKGPDCGGEPFRTLLPVDCQECKQIGGKSVQTDKGCDNC